MAVGAEKEYSGLPFGCRVDTGYVACGLRGKLPIQQMYSTSSMLPLQMSFVLNFSINAYLWSRIFYLFNKPIFILSFTCLIKGFTKYNS